MRSYFLAAVIIFSISVTKLVATGDTLSFSPDLSWTGLATDNFGSDAVWADVNGDGYDDIVIGASGTEVIDYSQGNVRVYFSNGITISPEPDQILIYNNSFENFGDCIKSVGDPNNDGYDDVLISAAEDDGSSIGTAILYNGGPSGLTHSGWEIYIHQSDYFVTFNALGEFDANLDGYSDVLICDFHTNTHAVNEGSIKLFLGSPTGIGIEEVWTTYGYAYDAAIGNSISVSDINADSWPDIAVAEEGFNSNIGKVQIFFGGPAGFPTTPSLEKLENYEDEQYGRDVDISGDLNNDGYYDLVISASNRINGNYTNAIDIYYGPITEFGEPDTILVYAAYNSGDFAGKFFVQDYLNDGYADILINTRIVSSDYMNMSLSIISCTADGIQPFPQWTSTVNGILHYGLEAVGDYNGDSLPDILVNSDFSDYVGVYTGKHNFPGLQPYSITYLTGYYYDYEYFGSSISTSGDINNDNINDLITGSGSKTHLFKGNYPEMMANHSWSYNLFQSGSGLGKSLKIIPDFDNDGYDDVIVGAPDYDYARTSDGFVALFKGSATGLSTNPVWVKTGGDTDYQLGFDVNAADLNGDGNTDFIVSAPNNPQVSPYISQIYIYFGNGSIPDMSVDLILKHDGNAGFGYRMATGDANGDGYNDILVTEDYSISHQAKVWLYFGGEIMDTIADWSFNPPVATQDFGEWISMDADYNFDGLNDIVIGNPSYTNGQSTEGCIYIFYGSGTVPATEPDKIIESDVELNKIGSAFAGGDINGDGFDELAVGFPEMDAEPDFNDNGIIKIFRGKASGIQEDDFAQIVGFSNTNTGKIISYSPDADGDSIGDLFVGHTFTATSGKGYIEMYKTIKEPCLIITDSTSTIRSDTTITVFWLEIGAENYNIRIRKSGTLTWTNISTSLNFATFTGLTDCTTYEVQLNAECATSSGAWKTFTTSTIGCPLPCNLVTIPSVSITGITGSTATISWVEPEEAISYLFRYKLVTSSSWLQFELPVNSVVLSTLTACSDYELQVKSDCGVDTSFWSASYLFTTTCGGCITPPSGLFANPITSTSAKLHWIADPGASKYKLYYRQTGAGSWIIVNAHSNFRTLPGLLPSTNYQYKVKSLCAVGIESGFSVTENFTTLPLRAGEQTEITLSINPSINNGQFTIEFAGFTNIPFIKIFSVNGQLIYETSAENLSDSNIYLSHAEPGLYLIELNDGLNKIIEKFIINH